MDTCRFNRRAALGLGAFGGLALLSSRADGSVKLFASPPLRANGAARDLVILQMSGGNDGLDTVVPFADDVYQRARPTLGRKKADVLALDDYRGLHPELKRMRKLFDAGALAIVEGCGYPDPIRSHFESMDVWHTADHRGRDAGEGWIGKLCRVAFAQDQNPNLVIHVGANVPYSLHSTAHPAASFINPQSYRWAGGQAATEAYERAGGMDPEHEGRPKKREGEKSIDFLRRVLADGQSSSAEVRRAVARYRSEIDYPNEALAQSLRDVAALVNGDTGTRVLSVELSGFDTHTDEKPRRDQVMKQLDGALGAFIDDLARSEAGRSAVVIVFSEFGRRVAENGARGTDHGVAAPMFVLGHQVKGGLHGKHPVLDRLEDGDLVHTTDFRSVYAAAIQRCFAVEPEQVLGERYPELALFRS